MATSQPDHSLDGQSSSELMMGLSISLVVLCTVVVGARIYTRTIMLNNAGLDDLLIVITQVRERGMPGLECDQYGRGAEQAFYSSLPGVST